MKRYCDYDAIVHYQPGEFASKFADNLNEKLKPANLDALEDEQANTFKDGQYGTFLTRLPLTVYRLYGQYQSNNDMGEALRATGARLGGQYVSTEFAESCIDAKIRLALDPCWHNTKMYEAKLIIPAGIKLYVGKVAPVKLCTGTILPGGAPQILLPKNWPEAWIQGYRRVSGRQLQIAPTYWPIKPDELAQGKEELYPDVCPRCCYSHVRNLKPDEVVTVTGSKGQSYTLKNCCLNPDCCYYW